MRKPLAKYSFLPRTINEMNLFINGLISSIDKMEQSFSSIDFETVPKNSKLPIHEDFNSLKSNLKQIGKMYEEHCFIKNQDKESTLTKFVFITPELNHILKSFPLKLLMKEDKYWMKRSDWLSVWSYWFRKFNWIEKGIITKLPEELENHLGVSSIPWKDFHTLIYKMTIPDDNVSEEWKIKWKEWKSEFAADKKEMMKKPKKVKDKKVKPVRKMIPRNSNRSSVSIE